MPKKVVSARLFELFKIAGLPQTDLTIPFENFKSKGIEYALEDNGMLSLTWADAGKTRKVLIGVSNIKYLELEPTPVG